VCLPATAGKDATPKYKPYFDDTMDEPIKAEDAEDYDLQEYQKLVSERALLARGNIWAPAKIIKRELDEDGIYWMSQ
jgi:hypothetical protein